MQITGLKSRSYAATLLRLLGKTVRLGKKDYGKADSAQKSKRPGRKKKYDTETVNV